MQHSCPALHRPPPPPQTPISIACLWHPCNTHVLPYTETTPHPQLPPQSLQLACDTYTTFMPCPTQRQPPTPVSQRQPHPSLPVTPNTHALPYRETPQYKQRDGDYDHWWCLHSHRFSCSRGWQHIFIHLILHFSTLRCGLGNGTSLIRPHGHLFTSGLCSQLRRSG